MTREQMRYTLIALMHVLIFTVVLAGYWAFTDARQQDEVQAATIERVPDPKDMYRLLEKDKHVGAFGFTADHKFWCAQVGPDDELIQALERDGWVYALIKRQATYVIEVRRAGAKSIEPYGIFSADEPTLEKVFNRPDRQPRIPK